MPFVPLGISDIELLFKVLGTAATLEDEPMICIETKKNVNLLFGQFFHSIIEFSLRSQYLERC